MKKLFVIIAVIFGVSFAACAQQGVCRVANGNGATVVVNVTNYSSDGTVDLIVSSDCDDWVNVSFTFTYQYNPSNRYDKTTSKEFIVLAQPNSETPKKVKIDVPKGVSTELVTIERVNISGARCK